MRLLTLILLLVNCATLQAQFTYFNQITGEQGDLQSEVTANVEVVDDGYVIWGGGVDDGQVFHFVRKYNLDGSIDNENVLIHEDQYVLSGLINTFKWNPVTDRFVFIHGTNLNGGTTEGYLIEFDENLDTTFTKRYDHYPPYTYPFIFEVMDDGYVVVGEQGGLPNSVGTFIMKLDFEGNVIWSEIMQEEVYQQIYRNNCIVAITEGYLISGWGRISSVTFGLLTITDEQGNTIETIEFSDPDMLRSLGMRAVRLANEDILISQNISYEWVEELGNPNVFWNKLRLSKWDETTLDTSDVVEHFDNYEFFTGGPNDILATPDGGAIILGGYFGWFFDAISWMLKVDANGNEEWYQEYTFETCDDCTNILYDIELTPDGGYIAAGSFVNYAIDPRTSSWLVKVDACGDLEWQGCAPLSVPERRSQNFTVYPNPSRGQFTVETSSQTRAKRWRIFDLSGRQVAQGSEAQAQQFSVDVNLPSGFYTLQVETEDGKMEAYKIQVVK